MSRALVVATTVAVASLLAVACGKSDGAPASADKKMGAPAAAPATAAGGATDEVALAGQRWDTLCVSCHGKTGVGDGPAAAALNPKPRSFGDAEWQGKVTDEHLAKVIVEGGAAAGLSPLMPPNPDLKDKPGAVAELVKRVRALKK